MIATICALFENGTCNGIQFLKYIIGSIVG